MSNKVMDYFNSVAKNYKTRSQRGPWSILRQKEKAIVASMIKSNQPIKSLDLGSGTGFYSNLLLEIGSQSIFALDQSENMLRQIHQEEVKMINAKAEDSYFTGEFDLILCCGLLEFCSDPKLILTNIKKSLKPDGQVIILTANDSLLSFLYRWYHKYNGIDISTFSQERLRGILSDCGLSIEQEIKVFPYSIVVSAFKDKCE